MVTLLTARTIKNAQNDIRCESLGQSSENGKWVGVINLYRDGLLHTPPLLTSKPVFDSESLALEAMELIVTQIRQSKLGQS